MGFTIYQVEAEIVRSHDHKGAESLRVGRVRDCREEGEGTREAFGFEPKLHVGSVDDFPF